MIQFKPRGAIHQHNVRSVGREHIYYTYPVLLSIKSNLNLKHQFLNSKHGSILHH